MNATAAGRPAPVAATDQARTTGEALESHYRFVVWLVPAVERFPRSRKFLLGGTGFRRCALGTGLGGVPTNVVMPPTEQP